MMNTATREKLYLGNNINVIPSETFPQNWPMHWHKQVELIFLPEHADITIPPVIQVDTQFYALEPGDVLIIWSGELHSTISNQDRQLIGLQFNSSILLDISDFSPYIPYFKVMRKIPFQSNPDMLQSVLLNLMHISSLSKQDKPFSHVEQTILLLESFVSIADNIMEKIKKRTVSSPVHSSDAAIKIQEACIFIAENCEKDLNLTETASRFGFSASYFSKIFRKYTTYHYIEYLNIQRLKYAQLLLADFTLPVTEVAYRSGFRSISSFNRIFHQQFSMSPSAYRRLYANNTV